MKKSVLLPYDRYQRLLSGMLENEASMSTSEQEHSSQHGSEDAAHVTENAIANNPEHQRASVTLTQHFPRSMQNRLRNLLTYIQPHLSWNDKGESDDRRKTDTWFQYRRPYQSAFERL